MIQTHSSFYEFAIFYFHGLFGNNLGTFFLLGISLFSITILFIIISFTFVIDKKWEKQLKKQKVLSFAQKEELKNWELEKNKIFKNINLMMPIPAFGISFFIASAFSFIAHSQIIDKYLMENLILQTKIAQKNNCYEAISYLYNQSKKSTYVPEYTYYPYIEKVQLCQDNPQKDTHYYEHLSQLSDELIGKLISFPVIEYKKINPKEDEEMTNTVFVYSNML